MMVEMDAKPTLHVTGPSVGPPTLANLIALARQLTGREPTAAEIDRAKQRLARRVQ